MNKKLIALGVIVVALFVWVFFIAGNKEVDTPTTVDTNTTTGTLYTSTVNGFSFTYPANWKISDSVASFPGAVVLDPERITDSEENAENGPGMIVFANFDQIRNSQIEGFESFPQVQIGKNNAIAARTFDKIYGENEGDGHIAGRHVLTYFVGENIILSYLGNPNDDQYLDEFNAIIASLEIAN